MLHSAPDASTRGMIFNFIADSSLSLHQAACSNFGSRSVVLGQQCHTPGCPVRAFLQWKSSVGAVIFWVPLSLEKGSRGDGEVFISSGHYHLVTLSLCFTSSFTHAESLISSDKALSILGMKSKLCLGSLKPPALVSIWFPVFSTCVHQLFLS